jgi:hypothetical protein
VGELAFFGDFVQDLIEIDDAIESLVEEARRRYRQASHRWRLRGQLLF